MQSLARTWRFGHESEGESVQTLPLRSGISLVLSHHAAGKAKRFRYTEPDDMVGIGFHLRGGSRFAVEECRFETQPLDVWAGAAPRGAESVFSLPRHGFLTASLRFKPDALQDLVQWDGSDARHLLDMVRSASSRAGFTRLAPLDRTARQCLQTMFSNDYHGTARRLLLESCALSLLAAQVHAGGSALRPARTTLPPRLKKQVFLAREYLDAHFTDPPTIQALSRIVGTNEFALKQGFKQAFGITIFGYVRQCRMDLAMDQLQAGHSVCETARAAGYECPRSFAHAFRRHFGALPSTISRRLRTETPDHHG
jgi:AraC-like DNA-binding protein